MLLLFETPAGYALFKVKDEGILENVEVRHRQLFGSLQGRPGRAWFPLFSVVELELRARCSLARSLIRSICITRTALNVERQVGY